MPVKPPAPVRNPTRRSPAAGRSGIRDIGQMKNRAGGTATQTLESKEDDRLALSLEQMAAVDKVCRQLKSDADFSRSRLRRTVLASFSSESDHKTHNAECRAALVPERHRAISDQTQSVYTAAESFGTKNNPDFVLLGCHLNELWDYVGLPIHEDFDLGESS